MKTHTSKLFQQFDSYRIKGKVCKNYDIFVYFLFF